MPPKRKSDNEVVSSSEKKRQKLASTRTIAVQSGSSASKGAKGTKVDSLQGLPATIDVEKFCEARAFEISAMQDAMKNASASSTSRAWQALPRHLRRRSASHDVRRVPLRLRGKALAEMNSVRKKVSSRSTPKLGKSRRLSRTEMFQKRQHDKQWLESHVWHAKRMKMENIWGYRLAIHPTEKAYRSSHRASIQDAILHDASYFSVIELSGPQKILKAVLDTCCDPQDVTPGAIRYSSGCRSCDTHFYRPGSYPFGLISPITVIWKPIPVDENGTQSEMSESKAKGCYKLGERHRTSGAELKENFNSEYRVLWLYMHPTAYEVVYSSLRSITSSILSAAQQAGEEMIEVEIADLRGQVNSFEIMGPKSNQVLKGMLNPIAQDQRPEFQSFWKRLGNITSPGEMSHGMLIGLTVEDPRLKFPPKNAKLSQNTELPGLMAQPSAMLAKSDIWSQTVRSRLAKPRFRKKDLDERRAKLLIPGTRLQASRKDDRIPVLLVRHSLRDTSTSRGIHGWIIIIPAGWSMAFLNSLTYTGTRVGGQRERRTQAFEAGTLFYPCDYPSSPAYEEYAIDKESQEKGRWSRKPPAKRVNFKKLGTRSPWRADWEVVLGLRNSDSSISADTTFTTTQREDSNIRDCDVRVWLLRGAKTRDIIKDLLNMFNRGAGLLEQINGLRIKRGHDPLDPSLRGDDILKAALISVRLDMKERGVPDELAMIYSVDDEEMNKSKKISQKAQKITIQDENGSSSDVPPDTSIIGYVTSGHFSLLQGQGTAVGAVSVTKLIALVQRPDISTHTSELKSFTIPVNVRNGNSRKLRPALLSLLD